MKDDSAQGQTDEAGKIAGVKPVVAERNICPSIHLVAHLPMVGRLAELGIGVWTRERRQGSIWHDAVASGAARFWLRRND